MIQAGKGIRQQPVRCDLQNSLSDRRQFCSVCAFQPHRRLSPGLRQSRFSPARRFRSSLPVSASRTAQRADVYLKKMSPCYSPCGS
ncbi:hypothetical protein HMPREF9549_03720 [Escherichia coli MS 185-1]|nr:hypothetical protein HMPREF9549_03720 [Escherichia coli MS 185-1]EFU58363.1 hypothetical protein HMPREF9545_01861 [Escherichia coli MS 16-3]